MYTSIWPEILKRKNHLEDLSVDEKIISKLIVEKYGADWIQLAQDKFRCQDSVNNVMKFWVP
jgi:hypothetical protein